MEYAYVVDTLMRDLFCHLIGATKILFEMDVDACSVHDLWSYSYAVVAHFEISISCWVSFFALCLLIFT